MGENETERNERIQGLLEKPDEPHIELFGEMDKLINVFKAKGFDDEESKVLAEYTIKLSEGLCIPIEQAQADAFAILSMAMSE